MPSSPYQTYLHELLQSAKWLGWEAPAATHSATSPVAASKSTPAERSAPLPDGMPDRLLPSRDPA